MDPTAQLQAFAQSVYLMIKDRYFDDLTSTDGQTYLGQVVDWTNMFIDELQYMTDSDGSPIDWLWSRLPMQNLGTAVYNSQPNPPRGTVSWNSTLYFSLCTGNERFVQIIDANNNVLANFTVVNASEVSNNNARNNEDRCALVNGLILFSRPFTQAENGCAIFGDVTGYLPYLTTAVVSGQIQATNVQIFSTVKPLTLLKLGVTKNAILPDIVKGGLTPSYNAKYNDLLTNAIDRSTQSTIAPSVDVDDYSNVRGVGI